MPDDVTAMARKYAVQAAPDDFHHLKAMVEAFRYVAEQAAQAAIIAERERCAKEEQDRGRVMALSEAMGACQKIFDETRFAEAVPEGERRALRTGAFACKAHLNAMQGEILKRYPITWTGTFPPEFLAAIRSIGAEGGEDG